MRSWSSLLMLLLPSAMPTAVSAADCPHAAYERYIRSVKTKNISEFIDSVTSNDWFYFINSAGHLAHSRQEYLDNHRRWFKKKKWMISYDPPLIAQWGQGALAMAVFHYMENQEDGTIDRLDAYFTLVMVKENNQWKAVADIITPISEK